MSDQNINPPDPAEFESCFLAFHPFAQLSEESIARFRRQEDDGNPALSEAQRIFGNHWIIAKYAVPIRWSEMARRYFDGNVEGMSEAIYHGSASTYTYGLVPAMSDRYWDTMNSNPLICQPEEGNLSPMLLSDLQWLSAVTNQKVWLYSYIGTRLLEGDSLVGWWWNPAEEADEYPDWKRYPRTCCMAEFGAEDRSWHVRTPCEALHSFILGPKSLLKKLITERKLEGFWFDHHQHKTMFDWLLPERENSWVRWSDVVLWP